MSFIAGISSVSRVGRGWALEGDQNCKSIHTTTAARLSYKLDPNKCHTQLTSVQRQDCNLPATDTYYLGAQARTCNTAACLPAIQSEINCSLLRVFTDTSSKVAQHMSRQWHLVLHLQQSQDGARCVPAYQQLHAGTRQSRGAPLRQSTLVCSYCAHTYPASAMPTCRAMSVKHLSPTSLPRCPHFNHHPTCQVYGSYR